MMKNELRGLRAKCNVLEDACLLSREDIYRALCQQDNVHNFIDNRHEDRKINSEELNTQLLYSCFLMED